MVSTPALASLGVVLSGLADLGASVPGGGGSAEGGGGGGGGA